MPPECSLAQLLRDERYAVPGRFVGLYVIAVGTAFHSMFVEKHKGKIAQMEPQAVVRSAPLPELRASAGEAAAPPEPK